jgi:uncharacterized protein YkwD
MRISRLLIATCALAWATGSPAQSSLDTRIEAAEQQLNADIKDCKPVDASFYQELHHEAQRNYINASQASKAGAPVDWKKLDDELQKTENLSKRAEAAAKQNCPSKKMTTAQPAGATQAPAAGQGAGKPPPSPSGEKPAPQQSAPAPPGQPSFANFSERIDQAERQLEADVKACKPIDSKPYQALYEEAQARFKKAVEAQREGIPVDAMQVQKDFERAYKLEGHAYAAASKNCPAPQKAGAQPQAPATDESGVQQPTLPPNEVFKPQKPKPNGPTGMLHPAPLNPFQQRILDIHNAERAAVGAAPLQWDPVLATHATEFAQQLAQTGQLAHAPREGRGIERENVQQGLIGWGPDQMLHDWVGEKSNFVPGTFPNVARDGNWMKVGHYSQMIWPTTTDIGCGQAEGLGFDWLVCRYSPGGNKDGMPVGHIPERGR